MLTAIRRSCRLRPKGAPRAHLMIMLTMMMVVAGMASPLMATVSAEGIAAKAATAEEAASQALQPLEPLATEIPTEEVPGRNAEQPSEETTEEVTEEATDVPTGEATDVPTGEVTEESTEEATEEGTETAATRPAAITVNLYWCPSGTAVSGATQGDPLTGVCTEQGPEITVSLVSNTSSSSSYTQTVSSFPGSVTFTPLAADDWTIDITSAVTVTEDKFFCNGLTPYGNTKPYSSYARLNAAAPAFGIDTLDEEEITCDWFGVLPEADGSTITITKWNCPEGFDFANAGYESAKQTCWDEVNPNVEFTVTSEGDAQDPNDDFGVTQATDPNSGDATTFTGLPEEPLTISESVPTGYALVAVYCAFDTEPAVSIDLTSANSFALSAKNGDTITCDVFDTFGAEPIEPMEPMQEGGTSLTIYKWECPEDIDATSTEATYFSGSCSTEMAGVPFTIIDGSANSPIATESDTNGQQIDGLIPDGNGNITIEETIPQGYGQPVVFCQADLNDDVSQYTVVDGGIVLKPAEGAESIQCLWFNIPTGETGYGNVHVYKWECTTEPIQNADHQWYQDNCTTPQNGVTFVLDTPNVAIQTNTGDTGNDGFAMMDGVETGTYPLTETIPGGYALAAVFCVYESGDTPPPAGDYTQYTPTNGAIEAIVQADTTYRCHFYNVPSEMHNRIHVTKWECPANYDTTGKSITDLQNDCTVRVEGVEFVVTGSGSPIYQTTDIDGEANFQPLSSGEHTLAEEIPAGYSMNPVVVCGGTLTLEGAIGDMFPQIVSAPGGIYTTTFEQGLYDIHCDFYNVPVDPSTVVINKWTCPEGVEPEPTIQWHQDNCATALDGVEFTLTDFNGPRSATTVGGKVAFDDVALGAIQISETIPTGYSNQPYLVCQITYVDGSGTGQFTPTTVNGVYNTHIDQPATEMVCDWYNHPVGPGEITVYKWTCPEGYDRTAWGADPTVDCTQATDGITFRLIQPSPEPELQTDTGDSIPGAVYFGGLEPGTYILNELLSPEDAAGMKEVFIWQCYGLTTSSVQPYPLNVGQMFEFTIVGNDEITCHWFNVPKPQYGWLDVTKFNCTTEKYVADVYCYTNQTGQEFNLQKWNGAEWTTVASGKTDVNGKLSFPNLEDGDYRLVEPNAEACLIKSSNITPDKNIGVTTGEATTVYVYNCKTPPPPTKTPTKYPNTGVGPSADSTEQRMPGVELAGMLGLAGVTLSRRRLLKRAAGITFGAGALALPTVAAQDLVPLDSTPAPATPGANPFNCGTPAAEVIAPDDSTPVVDQCALGAIPLQIRVPIIAVDAAIEYLEIIDGQMQPPTGAEDVAWFKETTRLGQVGNGIYAGHLNYWGVPEGVFFRLESLQEGDIIEIDGDDAITYRYEVQWTENFPSDEEPPEDALGSTDEVAITLITCGGEWVTERAEYDHRTLVRAVQLEDIA